MDVGQIKGFDGPPVAENIRIVIDVSWHKDKVSYETLGPRARKIALRDGCSGARGAEGYS